VTRSRNIATAALALGALAATSALQAIPAAAFHVGLKAAGDAGSTVHSVDSRPGFGNGPTLAGPGRNPAPFNPPGNFGNGGGGKFASQKVPGAFDPYKVPGGNGGGKLTPSGSKKNPNAFDPNQYRPPFGAQDGPTPFPTPTGTSQKNPNTFDPSKLPGGNGGGGGNIPPIGDPIANPNVPGGNPGGNLPPIGGNRPNPNLPWGGNGGGGTKGPKGHGHGHYGVYVDAGSGGYHPCWWLKRNYHYTGRPYWLNRYRFCMWRHYAN
jgi:hypothetical protein